MPKKKQPRNAFYFFMLDYKERCERNGERFPNGLRDVQEEAGPEWNAMSATNKKVYEDRAKAEKANLKGDLAKKVTNMHNSFDQVERDRRAKEEERMLMNKLIETTVMSLTNKRMMAEHKFYVIHVNYFCVSEGEVYHPAEVALAEFCLGSGVTNVYHTLINPGSLPLGYRHDAIQKAEATHKIPVEFEEGEKNFYKMWTDLNKFIQPGVTALGGEIPPIYTLPDNLSLNTSIKAVKSFMSNICDQDLHGSSYDKYRIYPVEKLFFELTNACAMQAKEDDNKFPTVGLALCELEKDRFCFTTNIACNFHQKEDVVQFCSKSYVQRWAYTICDFCCPNLDIEMIPGQHIPSNADTHYAERQESKRLEKEKPKPKPSFTWQGPSQQPWVEVENPPVNAPTQKGSANVTTRPQQSFDLSHFPSIGEGSFNSIGRGRGGIRGGRGQEPSMTFASAMRNNK